MRAGRARACEGGLAEGWPQVRGALGGRDLARQSRGQRRPPRGNTFRRVRVPDGEARPGRPAMGRRGREVRRGSAVELHAGHSAA
eukprot:10111924-Lingulodinium_polyedra.AAC.1